MLTHHKGYEAGEREDNDRCLVCLELVVPDNDGDSVSETDTYDYYDTDCVIDCKTCPRVIHEHHISNPELLDYLKFLNKHCPLCLRRGCFISGLGRPGHGDGENEWMRRIAVKGKWDRAVEHGTVVRQREDLVDDGSLESDRALIQDLGMLDERIIYLFSVRTKALDAPVVEEDLDKDDVDKPYVVQGEEAEDGDVEGASDIVVNTEEHTNGDQTVLESGRIEFDGNEVYVDVPDHIRIRGGFRDSGGQLWVPQKKLGPSLMSMRSKTYVHYN